MRIAILNDRSTLNHPFGRLLYESLLEDGHKVTLATTDYVGEQCFYDFSNSQRVLSNFAQNRLPRYEAKVAHFKKKPGKIAAVWVFLFRSGRKIDKKLSLYWSRSLSKTYAYVRSGIKASTLKVDVVIISRQQTAFAQIILVLRNFLSSQKLQLVYYPYEIYGHQFNDYHELLLKLEKHFIRKHYAALIAPSANRLAYYQNINPSLRGCVARNFKHYKPLPKLGIKNSDKLNLVYLGLIDYGRNIENILSSLEFMPKNFTLTLIGNMRKKWKSGNLEIINHYQSLGRLNVIDEIPEARIPEALAAYDIGLISYQASCLNNRLCAPAKITDYLHSDLSVIAPDLTGMQEIRELNSNIHLFKVDDISSLFSLLKELEPKLKGKEPGEIAKSSKNLNWIKEYENIRELLKTL